MTYNIIFYEDANGDSEIWNFLEDLRQKSATSKDARIQYNQAELYIQLLQDNGTRLPNNITKHIDEDIRELRPGNNRIFYFYCSDDSFVLLHSFRKKHRRHLVVKSTKQNQSVMTTYLERRIRTHENME